MGVWQFLVTHLEAIAFWSGAFVFAVWLVVMLPLAIRLESTSRWLGFPRAPILGRQQWGYWYGPASAV